MSEQSVMATPIFDELVNELGSQPQPEKAAGQSEQGADQQQENR